MDRVRDSKIRTAWICIHIAIPGSGISSGEENGSPLQYSCLESPMDRGAWQATVHGIAESDMTERLTLSFSLSAKMKPRNPLQQANLYCSIRTQLVILTRRGIPGRWIHFFKFSFPHIKDADEKHLSHKTMVKLKDTGYLSKSVKLHTLNMCSLSYVTSI